MLEKIIFSIDKTHSTRTQAKFLRYVDTLRAMNKISSPVASCIGMYEGELERSYMMDYKDFKTFVSSSGYVDNQKCFLLVPGDTRQPCTLIGEGTVQSVGPMVETSGIEDLSSWTYVEETGKYFKTVGG